MGNANTIGLTGEEVEELQNPEVSGCEFASLCIWGQADADRRLRSFEEGD